MIWITGAGVLITLASMIVAIVACADARKSRKAAEKATGISSDLYEQGKVRFALERIGRTNSHMLTNTGTHTAYDVTVSAPMFTATIYQQSPVELRSGANIKVAASVPSGPKDKRLIVGYRKAPDGPVETFTLHT